MRFDGLRKERVFASPRFRDGIFHNTADNIGMGLEKGSGQLGIMGEFFFGGRKRKPPGVIHVDDPLPALTAPVSESGLRVTWLGHSTMLLEINGLRVLTDPVWGARLGPVSFAGPKRFHAAPIEIAQLPPLDAILISHDHYDHLCKPSVIELARAQPGVPFVTSLGVGQHMEKFGIPAERIHELDWYETFTVPGRYLSFTATPSQHFSGRFSVGRNATLWSSWVIQTPHKKLFFSGDTGLTPEFGDIHARFGPFDLVMLEIGAWHPAWGKIHLGPENALTAFEMLGGGTLMPVHWGTFDLGLHPWAQPAETLLELAAARNARILTPMLGRPFEPALVEGPTPWWRAVGEEPVVTSEPATA
jgi:L-ascorbate metabolism protein UlaG (beta-lactamase superfamily)